MKTKYYGAMFIVLALCVAGGVVHAQGQGAGGGGGASGAGQSGQPGAGNPDQLQEQDQDRIQDPAIHDGDEPLQARDQDHTQDMDRVYLGATTTPGAGARAQSAQQLRTMLEEQVRIFQDEAASSSAARRLSLENQNRVREAVFAFLAAEDLLPGIGAQVSAIAQEFNNRVMSTIEAEETIRARSALARALFGGDDTAAQVLEREREQVQERLQEVKQLLGSCAGCDEQVRAMLQEHLQTMEQEQERLRQLAEEELGRRGIFGWLFGWL